MTAAGATANTSVAAALRADRRALVAIVLLTSIALAYLLALAGIEGTLREVIALIPFTFAPGAAIVMRLKPVGALPSVGLSAAISLAVTAFGAWLMIEIGWYVPWLLMTVVLTPAALALLGEPVRVARAVRTSRPAAPHDDGSPNDSANAKTSGDLPQTPTLPFAAPLVTGVALWLLSLSSIDLGEMTDIGVASVLPPTWLAGFALTLGGGVVYAARGGRNPWLLAGYVAGVATIIYGTLPLVSDAAHYPAAYKHVGVVQLFLEHGHLRPNADIYNRWPGFFALAGAFKSFSGADSALRHIAWAELYFILLQSALVAAIALKVFRRAAVATLAALLFLLINWIGQNYYSPQAFVFIPALAALWIVLSQLGDTPNALGRFVDRVAGWVSRSEPPDGAPPAPSWDRRQAVALVLLMQAAIVVSHQLTPYAFGLQLGLLLICGFARPRWLLVAIAALPIVYLLPHLGWINDHFGIFTKLDPFSNAQVNDPIAVKCDGCETVGSMATLNSAVAWLGAIAGAILLTRRAPATRPQVLLMLMLAPFLFLGGQNYGGEAPLRVVMFASPFTAALIAGALLQLRPVLRQLLALALAGVLGFTLLLALYGGEPFSAISKTEVRVAKYIYANGEKGMVVMSAAPTFPDLLAANYNDFLHLNGGGQIILFDRPGEQRGRLGGGAESVQFVADQLRLWGYDGYIVFSPNTDRYNAFNNLATEEQSRQVRQAMVESGRFRLWHKDGDVEVFEFVK
ncbi:MAG: hypothetical protein HZB14_10640 [Actinobacteria bacterium]|nr:hypothetical protein [Actinomycetota bacterium]